MDIFRSVLAEAEKLTNKAYSEIDTEFLVDLLLEMSNDFKDSVVFWVAANISHRLKLELCPNPNPRNKWIGTVERIIDNILMKFRRSPSLEVWLQDNFDEAWELAKKDYNRSRRDFYDLPENPYSSCPYTLAQILKYPE